jgi:hypothetical protein
METFHLVVLSVAIVLLILVLVFIGILMSKGETNLAYPPSYGTCPDYWTIATDGSKCIVPTYQSSLNLGSMYDQTQQLTASVSSAPGYSYDPGWTGICSKKSWANMLGIVWDGVSNYNECN